MTKNSWSLVIGKDGKNPQIQHGVIPGRIQQGLMDLRMKRKKQEKKSKISRLNDENKVKMLDCRESEKQTNRKGKSRIIHMLKGPRQENIRIISWRLMRIVIYEKEK